MTTQAQDLIERIDSLDDPAFTRELCAAWPQLKRRLLDAEEINVALHNEVAAAESRAARLESNIKKTEDLLADYVAHGSVNRDVLFEVRRRLHPIPER